jgi:KaiC/GvpD/RAD55 family RecA-like ATPase
MSTTAGQLGRLAAGKIGLALVNPRKHASTGCEILHTLSGKNRRGIYVTVNRPYDTVVADLKKAKVDAGQMFFIDAITKMVGGQSGHVDNATFIGSPQLLTELSIAIDKAIEALPKGKRFLYFDSINGLMMYNNPGAVARFVHFLSGRMREQGVSGIFIAADGETENFLPFISQCVDKVVRIK